MGSKSSPCISHQPPAYIFSVSKDSRGSIVLCPHIQRGKDPTPQNKRRGKSPIQFSSQETLCSIRVPLSLLFLPVPAMQPQPRSHILRSHLELYSLRHHTQCLQSIETLEPNRGCHHIPTKPYYCPWFHLI